MMILKKGFHKCLSVAIVMAMVFLVSVDNTAALSDLKIHFINVGAGDGILIECNGEVALIDGGYASKWAQYGEDENDPLLNDVDRVFNTIGEPTFALKTQEEKDQIYTELKTTLQQNKHNEVVDYIEQLGIQKIDVLVSTHPHMDHVGGLVSVICNYPIGKIYKSKLDYKTRYSMAFDRLIELDENLQTITSVPAENEQFRLGGENGALFTVLNNTAADYENSADSPNGDTNNYSIVMRMDYGKRSFLFTGDSQRASETYMLENHKDQIVVDILKQPHHGWSNPDGYISTEHSGHYDFTSVVNAYITVVSCGPDSPHKKVENDMANSDVYRTNNLGNIVLTTDGQKVDITYGESIVYAFYNGDVNANGRIDAADYLMIKDYIMGKISSLQ